MGKLLNWFRKNTEMTLTIICGVLIVAGFILQYQGRDELAVPCFIIAFLVGGYHSAKEGVMELVHDHHLSVDVLMILAAVGASLIGYWMEGALLIFIFSLAESLESMSIARSKNAIAELMKVTPDTARRYNDAGELVEVGTEELSIGDRLQVRKGESVPIDGELIGASAIINEAAITGEPLPVTKQAGDELIGGTINEEHAFDMRVTVENQDTLFQKIIKMVEEAQASPSKTDSFIKRIEDNYVKVVLVAVPLFILLAPTIFGWTWEESFYRGMVLLTVASPCALVASAAPANLSAISRAAKRGMIFKGGETLDNTANIQAIVFDKTGTLTEGKPSVIAAEYIEGADTAEIDQIVKAAENTSTHPIALAFLDRLEATPLIKLDQLEDLTGKGFQIQHGGHSWRIGSQTFILSDLAHELDPALAQDVKDFEAQGATVIFVSRDQEFVAFYALADALKPESKQTIELLNQAGIVTIMLTGDQRETAEYIASQIGIQEVHANLLPQDKAHIIEELSTKHGDIAMVGDGINDAPALATANVGMAMGSGTDIAMETADVVIMQDDLSQIPFAIGLSHQMNRIVKQNIIFSLSVIVLLIISNIMQVINLPLGVIGHEGSTILVILNGLRLLNYNLKLEK